MTFQLSGFGKLRFDWLTKCHLHMMSGLLSDVHTYICIQLYFNQMGDHNYTKLLKIGQQISKLFQDWDQWIWTKVMEPLINKAC